MKYRRIGKDTVQCIVTGEDLEEYGLQMSDIFERNERGEGFLRDLIQEAHEEVGYNCTGNSIAMQISPFKDNGMVITFCEEADGGFKNLLEHMRDVIKAVGFDGLDELHDLSSFSGDQTDENTNEKNTATKKEKKEKEEQYAETRIFEFSSLNDVIDFSKGVTGATQLRSCLVKSDHKYYLVTMKNRMSWKNYNKLSAKAFDFAKVVVDSDEKLIYLGEHGELLIENGAVNKLSKL